MGRLVAIVTFLRAQPSLRDLPAPTIVLLYSNSTNDMRLNFQFGGLIAHLCKRWVMKQKAAEPLHNQCKE
jgi:hypothetical protein